ncbi:hypothetical protein ACHAXM_002794 [Skeletonema potamos]|jgi:Leu/Phe-tRNA-protein transferase
MTTKPKPKKTMAAPTDKLSIIIKSLLLRGGNEAGTAKKKNTTTINQAESEYFATTTSAASYDDESSGSDDDYNPTPSLPPPPKSKLNPSKLIPTHLSLHIKYSHGEFYTTRKRQSSFDSSLITQLMVAGFIPISTKNRLMPKLHNYRCIINLQQSDLLNSSASSLHIPRSIRKKSKRYTVSINTSFHGVVKGCHAQHGVNWLWPKIVDVFRELYDATLTGDGTSTPLYRPDATSNFNLGSSSSSKSIPIRLYSVELYNTTTNNLVAGELGYTVGSIYTSLTGFTSESSAGSVQLAVLGKLLTRSGFTHWDLGTAFEYKQRLGAVMIEREEFLRLLYEVRQDAKNEDCVLSLPSEKGSSCSAKAMIDSVS